MISFYYSISLSYEEEGIIGEATDFQYVCMLPNGKLQEVA